ncbi:hypothetical protein B0H11DRAFT_1899441 [Mycena galericulata]|nr:hypothetical protein B0H11DRAFT_1899441 [Mycena galericulata]
MDDAQFVAGVAASVLLEFRASQFTAAFVAGNAGIFLNLDWVHPAQLRAFLRDRGQHTLTPLGTVSVKEETSDLIQSVTRVKVEDSVGRIPIRSASSSVLRVRTRETMENDREVIEVLSSDDEMEVEKELRPSGASSDPPEPAHPSSDSNSDDELEESGIETVSTTVWCDTDIISKAIDGLAHINRQTKVQRVEYLNELASGYPVPRVPTAYVLDLRDPKFDFRAGADGRGELLNADALILNRDQESWNTSSGGGDQEPICLLFNGKPVKCRRSRHRCKGCYRCSELDASLVHVTRFELDPSSRTKVISAEIATRAESGDTREKLVAAFYRALHSDKRKCSATDEIGAPCTGHPVMNARNNGAERKGTETAPCSRIISPRIGERQKFCAHIHLRNGANVRGTMIHHPCQAYMTIFVPLDLSLRMACVILDHTKPHTHPMPPRSKASLEVKAVYRHCVRQTGALGMTVQKVDDAPTTLLLLKGQSPAMFHPSLHTKRVKQTIIHDEKLLSSPEGLGLAARTVQVDTTFGRTAGELNEWEFVIWYGSVERGRVYTNGADRPHYKCLFDELQKIIYRLTGKHLRFKRFTRGGNLITMGVDMEAAQVQGACDSFLPTNEPEYSGITTTDPDELAFYYIRACISHCKRGVHQLKPHVTNEVFTRLMDFPYMKTQEDVDKFTEWIAGLKIKKVQNWWKHKLQYPWIIPSLIKSLSRITPEDWDITDSTTNLNEGQHHWTNQQTGVNLTLLESVEGARKADFKSAREVKDTVDTGILDNNSNNLVHRMGRKIGRNSNAAGKARAAGEQDAAAAEAQLQYDEAKAAKKLSDQLLKVAQANLSAAKPSGRKHAKKAAEPLLVATSSGHVLSPRRARRAAPSLVAPSVLPVVEPLTDATSGPGILPPAGADLTSFPPTTDSSAWIENLNLPVPGVFPPANIQDFMSFPPTNDSSAWLDRLNFMLPSTTRGVVASADFVQLFHMDTDSLDVFNDPDSATYFHPTTFGTEPWDVAQMDSLDAFLRGDTMTAFPGTDSDINFPMDLSPIPELPILRGPPSPRASPFTTPPAPVASPAKRRARASEVDEANIVTTSRTRVPSKRVLGTQDRVDFQAKKPKSRK